MAEAEQPPRRAHLYPKLLMKLPRQRLRRRLAWLDLAAREFPLAGGDLALRTLRDQYRTGLIDQDTAGYLDERTLRLLVQVRYSALILT